MTNTLLDAACAGIRAVCVPYAPQIAAETIEDLCAIIKGEKVAVKADTPAPAEPPMSCAEAARLLNMSKTALHNHIRAGRIRRVMIQGSSRGRGVVAADIRAILEGRAA